MMKRNINKAMEALRDEFMSREPAVCSPDWMPQVMSRLAAYYPAAAVLSPRSNAALLWPLAWSTAAIAVAMMAATFFFDPSSTTATTQLFSEINPAVQIVAAL
ncbi:MAG: hypothetical protein PHQ27_05320 [Victivallales bacterium]|nr:hypothetical protein [Victivallales bacterium]